MWLYQIWPPIVVTRLNNHSPFTNYLAEWQMFILQVNVWIRELQLFACYYQTTLYYFLKHMMRHFTRFSTFCQLATPWDKIKGTFQMFFKCNKNVLEIVFDTIFMYVISMPKKSESINFCSGHHAKWAIKYWHSNIISIINSHNIKENTKKLV